MVLNSMSKAWQLSHHNRFLIYWWFQIFIYPGKCYYFQTCGNIWAYWKLKEFFKTLRMGQTGLFSLKTTISSLLKVSYTETTKKVSTHIRARVHSYRNQTINLNRKSIDRFLCVCNTGWVNVLRYLTLYK